MGLLRFLFTGRKSFLLFALLAFLATLAYLAWHHRYCNPAVIERQRLIDAQREGADRLRQMHRDSSKAIREYKGPQIPPKAPEKGQQR